jgi:hypothetical protein
MNALNYFEMTITKMTITKIILVLLLPALNAGLWLWLIVLGIGLLTMKRWARRGSVLYAWINIGLFVIACIAWSCHIFMVLSGRVKLPEGMLIASIRGGLIALIYPVLLLIFMKTKKVKRAFSAIGG